MAAYRDHGPGKHVCTIIRFHLLGVADGAWWPRRLVYPSRYQSLRRDLNFANAASMAVAGMLNIGQLTKAR